MKRFFVLLLIAIAGCSPAINSHFTNPGPQLAEGEPVAMLDVVHELPENVLRIGSLRFEDSGFSTDCSFNSIMNRARIIAGQNGANIVKVIDKTAPNLWSSCYRLTIELYKFEGDVSGLPQYQPRLD